MFKILLYSLSLVTVWAQTPPQSPCPQLYTYEMDDSVLYGVLQVPYTSDLGSDITTKIKLSLPTRLPTKYVGQMELYEDKAVVRRNVANGLPLKYRIHFPLTTPIPSLMNVILNNRVICNGPSAVGRITTMIDLQHNLQLGMMNYNPVVDLSENTSPENNQYMYSPTASPFTMPYVQPTPQTMSSYYQTTPAPTMQYYEYSSLRPTIRVTQNNIAQICGTKGSSDSVGLIIKGETPERDEWPWLVAVYKRKHGALEFVCGATLISDTLVVTAAHCVTDTNRVPLRTDKLILKLGAYNIDDWTDQFSVTRNVYEIHTKDYFKNHPFSNDIAVLKISQAVTFTQYIRPACLWSGSNYQDLVYGMSGVVVGWGRDEDGYRVTSEPKMVSVPIVSTVACRGSNAKFFQLTSNTTLCAGNKQGAGPCSGDSGGGLYVKQGDRWVVRGIVSNALKDERQNCNLMEYVVYTDCAQYVSWIRTMQSF